jgi:hypothetical protein
VKKILPTTNVIIAVVSGVLVLLGYFFSGVFESIQSVLLGWAIILAAFALLLGIFNLAMVHWKKVNAKGSNSIYSIVLLVSLGITIVVAGLSGPTGGAALWIFNTFQVPVEVSLLAILAVVLIYTLARLISRRPRWYTILFLVTVLVVLIGMCHYSFGELSLLTALRGWIAQVPAVAGARGLLLGVALGTVATGLRILLGVDRPYGG